MASDRLWDNPGLRRALTGVILAAAVIGLLLAIATYRMNLQLQQEIHNRELAVIGTLVTQHPELTDQVAEAYAQQATQETLQAGRKAAARVGFADVLPLSLDQDFDRHQTTALLTIGAAGLALMVSLTLLLLTSFRRMYRMVEAYSDLAERIVEGDFHLKAHRTEEGVFAKLAHQFNQMSNRLQWTVERLQAEKQGMKELLSDISHQLKTPLSSLKMFNELLQDGADQDEATRADFLRKSEIQIESMEWLIRQLLIVARMEAGSAVLERKLCSTPDTIREVIRKLTPMAEAKELELHLAYEPPSVSDSTSDGDDHSDLELLHHDPSWLGEAIGNLVKNSIEHTPPGGHITVELQLSSLLHRIIVRDDGEGIEKEELPYIFRRFHKSGRRSPSGEGTGIGLALSKAIVERHEGFLTATSTRHRGTAMTITLPRLPPQTRVPRNSTMSGTQSE